MQLIAQRRLCLMHCCAVSCSVIVAAEWHTAVHAVDTIRSVHTHLTVVLRWTGKFLSAQPDTLGSVFAQAAASLHCGSTSSSAVVSDAVLCLYDHMRACLKLRASHGVSAKARKEALACAAECGWQLAQRPRTATSSGALGSNLAAVAETVLLSLYPNAGTVHSTGKKWALEEAIGGSSAAGALTLTVTALLNKEVARQIAESEQQQQQQRQQQQQQQQLQQQQQQQQQQQAAAAKRNTAAAASTTAGATGAASTGHRATGSNGSTSGASVRRKQPAPVLPSRSSIRTAAAVPAPKRNDEPVDLDDALNSITIDDGSDSEHDDASADDTAQQRTAAAAAAAAATAKHAVDYDNLDDALNSICVDDDSDNEYDNNASSGSMQQQQLAASAHSSSGSSSREQAQQRTAVAEPVDLDDALNGIADYNDDDSVQADEAADSDDNDAASDSVAAVQSQPTAYTLPARANTAATTAVPAAQQSAAAE
eukprot:6799-Heterococcus_DN1.PRE.1